MSQREGDALVGASTGTRDTRQELNRSLHVGAPTRGSEGGGLMSFNKLQQPGRGLGSSY